MLQTDQMNDRPQLFTLIDQMAALLEQCGIPRIAPSTDVRSIYASFDPSYRQAIEARVQSQIDLYAQILHSAKTEGYDVLDDKRSTWAAFKYLKMRPPSSLFEKIEDGDVIEFYDFNGVQIYRNFEFFRYTSYSLEDIFVNTFDALYERDESITNKLWAGLELVKTLNGPMDLDIEEHDFCERLSKEERMMRINFVCISPVFSAAGEHAALFISSRPKILVA